MRARRWAPLHTRARAGDANKYRVRGQMEETEDDALAGSTGASSVEIVFDDVDAVLRLEVWRARCRLRPEPDPCPS